MKIFSILPLLLLTISFLYADCINPSTNLSDQENIKKVFECFQKEINTLKSSRAITVNAIDGLPKPTIEKTTTIGNYEYNLLGCTRKSSSVTCKLQIVNMGKDSRSSIITSYVYDEKGQKFRISSAFILDKQASSKSDFISKIPMSAHFTVNDFPTDSTQLSAIKLSTDFGKVIFKGIVIK